MINLRMIGIASAILLFVPIGMAAWPEDGPDEPDEMVVEGGAEALFEVTDVTLANLPREKIYDRDSFQTEEQLVEGHTVFAVIDVTYRFNETNGTIDIWGDVHCNANVTAEGPTRNIQVGPYTVPLTIPTQINRGRAHCTVAGQTVVMPDPTQDMFLAPPQPTGRQFPYSTPTGETGSAVEYAYDVAAMQPDGSWEPRTRYAWVVPIHTPWLDYEGRPKNFYCPIPEDRLVEMGLEDFRVYHLEDAPGFG